MIPRFATPVPDGCSEHDYPYVYTCGDCQWYEARGWQGRPDHGPAYLRPFEVEAIAGPEPEQLKLVARPALTVIRGGVA